MRLSSVGSWRANLYEFEKTTVGPRSSTAMSSIVIGPKAHTNCGSPACAGAGGVYAVGPSPFRGLSPRNPLIQALAEITVDRNVPFHSIIGDRGLGDGEQGSDGVVPYKSAHLDGAESELIVPADHSAHVHPLAMLEVKRILKLHLHQNGLPRS